MTMNKIILLSLLLVGCATKYVPITCKKVEIPYIQECKPLESATQDNWLQSVADNYQNYKQCKHTVNYLIKLRKEINK